MRALSQRPHSHFHSILLKPIRYQYPYRLQIYKLFMEHASVLLIIFILKRIFLFSHPEPLEEPQPAPSKFTVPYPVILQTQ